MWDCICKVRNFVERQATQSGQAGYSSENGIETEEMRCHTVVRYEMNQRQPGFCEESESGTAFRKNVGEPVR
jgi:hypothetical protein